MAHKAKDMEGEWICVNCGLSFGDPRVPEENENIVVLSVRRGTALVMMDGLPHSLKKRTAELQARHEKAESSGLDFKTVYAQNRRAKKEKGEQEWLQSEKSEQ